MIINNPIGVKIIYGEGSDWSLDKALDYLVNKTHRVCTDNDICRLEQDVKNGNLKAEECLKSIVATENELERYKILESYHNYKNDDVQVYYRDIICNGIKCAVYDFNEYALFNPREYGIKEADVCDGSPLTGISCDMGEHLYLTSLCILTAAEEPVEVFGVKPISIDGSDLYENLKHKVDYTGSLFFTRGELSGNQWRDDGVLFYKGIWGYETLIEVRFDQGEVVKIIDHSEFIKRLRRHINKFIDMLGRPEDPTYWWSYEESEEELYRNYISYMNSLNRYVKEAIMSIF